MVANAAADIVPTGTVTVGSVAKGDGAPVGEAPAVSGTPTQNSITVNPVNIPSNPGSQTVEYAISTLTSVPASGWQTSTVFNNLSAGTAYYAYARSAANTNYNAGTAQQSAAITTTPNVVSSKLTFTVDNVNSTAGKDILIPIRIANNTNDLTTFSVRVDFDGTRLEWQNLGTYDSNSPATHPWTLGIMPLAMDMAPAAIGANSVLLNFMDLAGITNETGLLMTLKLRVKEGAPLGDGNITLTFTTNVGTNSGSLSKDQYGNIPGKVTVINVVYGDVDGSSSVDIFDLLYLIRYFNGFSGYEVDSTAADVDGVSGVDIFDALYLVRHLNGFAGYEVLGR